mmetsp:Transcript_33266/g.98942  ORF Transcript_33266/g.98942 Transcript_33266/m.98942 type:complete len:305 (-) Transcript_33266:631-1545(-)
MSPWRGGPRTSMGAAFNSSGSLGHFHRYSHLPGRAMERGESERLDERERVGQYREYRLILERLRDLSIESSLRLEQIGVLGVMVRAPPPLLILLLARRRDVHDRPQEAAVQREHQSGDGKGYDKVEHAEDSIDDTGRPREPRKESYGCEEDEGSRAQSQVPPGDEPGGTGRFEAPPDDMDDGTILILSIALALALAVLLLLLDDQVRNVGGNLCPQSDTSRERHGGDECGEYVLLPRRKECDEVLSPQRRRVRDGQPDHDEGRVPPQTRHGGAYIDDVLRIHRGTAPLDAPLPDAGRVDFRHLP